MVARLLHPAGQGGIPRRKKLPTLRHAQDFAIVGSDGVRRRAGGERVVAHALDSLQNRFLVASAFTAVAHAAAASSCTAEESSAACRASSIPLALPRPGDG